MEDGHLCREPQVPPQEQQLAPGSTSGSVGSALVSWQAQGCSMRDTDPKTPLHCASVPSHTQGRAHKRQCPTHNKEPLKAFTKSMQGFSGMLIFKLEAAKP